MKLHNQDSLSVTIEKLSVILSFARRPTLSNELRMLANLWDKTTTDSALISLSELRSYKSAMS
jgi:hypothetical protein